MKKCVLALIIMILFGSVCLGEEIPSLRQPDDADLDAGIYDSFFDDAVFVGDSVTKQLSRYVQEQRQKTGKDILGKARFLCRDNYSIWIGCHTNLYGELRLKYQGKEVTIQGGLQKMGAGKAFVMLGLNDHAGSQMEKDVRRFGLIIDHVLEKNPDILFVAQSCTPIVKGAESKTRSRKNFTGFNENLKVLCEEKGVYYLDVATAVTGDDGYMIPEYAYDKLAHMNDKGLKVWLTELRRFARDMYEQGLWKMEE